MGRDFFHLLITPSPVMHWLLMLFPMTVTLSGLFGAAERHDGYRRLALWGAALTVWLFLPWRPADPVLAGLAGALSILAWLGLLGQWARQVWDRWPSPVWAHALVISHIVAILVACVVALVRAWLNAV